MSYLREQNVRIPKEDYVQVRNLLDVLNADIHNYNKNKKKRFNLKYWINEIKVTIKSARAAEIKKIENNAKVEEFYRQYGYTLINAFLSYTPFLKSRIVLMLFIHLLHLAGKEFWRDMEWVKNKVDTPNFHSKLKPG